MHSNASTVVAQCRHWTLLATPLLRVFSLRTLHFLSPGDPNTLTGGYIYNRSVSDALGQRGWWVVQHRLGDGFPQPSDKELSHARAVLEALDDDALVVIDGLALGAMPDVAREASARLRLVALVHHPLALETGLDESTRERLWNTERAALGAVAHVIVTSNRTVEDVAPLGVPAHNVTVVEPGTVPAALRETAHDDSLQLLCVASITPRKGHAVLLEALGGLTAHRWTLHCVGSATRSPQTASEFSHICERLELADRVVLHGELSGVALDERYARADAFVLASYHEGYGMVLAEALAHGLPVVATRAGAVADTVPEDAGLLVKPGDVDALRAGLRALLEDASLRTRLRNGALRAREQLPSWSDAGARFEAALLGVL